jgi:hypothetical protein
MADKIKNFLKNNEAKIALIAGFILIAVISFEFGLIQGKKIQNSPLIIEKAAQIQTPAVAAAAEASKTAQEAVAGTASTETIPKDCAFVGSKNSTKYHVPSCTFAKRILPKNLVCFKSAEEAQSQGRQPDKGCIK